MLYVKCRIALLFLASLITLGVSIAQPTQPWFERVQLQMMVSSSYSINVNNPANDSNSYRSSDLEANRFLLDMVQISLQQIPTKANESGFRFDLAMGEVARIYPTGFGSCGDYTINQAYISYIAPMGKGLRADAGLFATHCGYEFMEGVDGWNDHATHSFRYAYAEPTVHSGLRFQYPWSERFTTSFILAQGAFSYRDNNKAASF
ncbi:MAG: porin, partial [bacterium]|nr:porin [bacterium]